MFKKFLAFLLLFAALFSAAPRMAQAAAGPIVPQCTARQLWQGRLVLVGQTIPGTSYTFEGLGLVPPSTVIFYFKKADWTTDGYEPVQNWLVDYPSGRAYIISGCMDKDRAILILQR